MYHNIEWVQMQMSGGFMGSQCQTEIDECVLERPCKHGGYAATLTDRSYKCTCMRGYTGMQCETKMSSCSSEPCFNKGNCLEQVQLDSYAIAKGLATWALTAV
eukprot:gene10490-19202_t